MTAKDSILTSYAASDRLINAYLGDFTDAELRVRPVPKANHAAWQVGHLITTIHNALEAIRPGSTPALPPGFAETHARDEASTTSNDAARFLTKSAYLEHWNAHRAAAKALLASLTDAEMDAPGLERLRAIAPTVGTSLQFLAMHEVLHIGQIAVIRRALDKPIMI